MMNDHELKQDLSALYDGQKIDGIVVERIFDYYESADVRDNFIRYTAISSAIKDLSEDGCENLNFSGYADISKNILDQIKHNHQHKKNVEKISFLRLSDIVISFLIGKNHFERKPLSLSKTFNFACVLFFVSSGTWFAYSSLSLNDSKGGIAYVDNDKKVVASEVMIRDPKLDELMMLTRESNKTHYLQRPVDYLRNSNFTSEP